MKGLRLTIIKSRCHDTAGNLREIARYQLWEHPVYGIKDVYPLYWGNGRIIQHLRTWKEAMVYFNEMQTNYEAHKVEEI